VEGEEDDRVPGEGEEGWCEALRSKAGGSSRTQERKGEDDEGVENPSWRRLGPGYGLSDAPGGPIRVLGGWELDSVAGRGFTCP
jgi:hypothetical protein